MKTCTLVYRDYVYRVNFYFLTCLRSGINLTLSPWQPQRSMKPYVASAVMTSLATCSPLTKKVSSLSGVTIRASLSPFCREGMKKGEKVQGCYFSTRVYAHGKGQYDSHRRVLQLLQCEQARMQLYSVLSLLHMYNQSTTMAHQLSSSHAHHNSHMHYTPYIHVNSKKALQQPFIPANTLLNCSKQASVLVLIKLRFSSLLLNL